jgi:hypothetical protein
MGFYEGLAATATALLKDKGQTMTLISKSAAAYDPATATSAETEVSTSVTGVSLNYPDKEVDGANIMRGDKKVLLSAAVEPKVQDVLIIGGERNKVLDCKALRPAGVSVIYTLQVRAGA